MAIPSGKMLLHLSSNKYMNMEHSLMHVITPKQRSQMFIEVKHDERHKARLVADGHLTQAPLDSVYSGVVSLHGLCFVLFLAELNKLELWATDIGNAYLEAFTSDQVYIIAGPEFNELEVQVLIISKAIYGLCSSGAR
jgi:Reverse transcriptase (RNA-dependent DNA polymerase)